MEVLLTLYFRLHEITGGILDSLIKIRSGNLQSLHEATVRDPTES